MDSELERKIRTAAQAAIQADVPIELTPLEICALLDEINHLRWLNSIGIHALQNIIIDDAAEAKESLDRVVEEVSDD